MDRKPCFFLSLAMLALGCSSDRAQGLAPDKELVVATKEAPPFAMKQPDGSWGGISIDLWNRIADGAHLRFRLVETQSVQDMLDGVAKGDFDAGVAAVTVTAARARNVDFTQPFRLDPSRRHRLQQREICDRAAERQRLAADARPRHARSIESGWWQRTLSLRLETHALPDPTRFQQVQSSPSRALTVLA